MTVLDHEFVRRQFPAFMEPTLEGKAFFENAGGSYMCRQVMDRFDHYFKQCKVQPYYPNPVSSRAGELMDASYSTLAPWLNITAEEVYFGPSTSQNTYVLANAVLGWLQPGDEIIVTNQDHEANSGVWRRLADRGLKICEWSVDAESGRLDVDDLQALITKRSKLLVFPHCSNILGEVNPVNSICRLARDQGIRTVVDGVSFAGHGMPDVKTLDTDIYLFSLYKVYGPHLGVMIIRNGMAELLNNQGHFFNAEVREKRLYPAGPDHAQVAAVTGVGDYFEAVYQHHFDSDGQRGAAHKAQALRTLFHKAEQRQLQPLMEYFRQHPSIRIVGPEGTQNRAPTISLRVRDHSSQALVSQLGERGIICGAGHFYSWRLLEALGLDPNQGVLRFSLVHYTSDRDTQTLIANLDALIS